MDSRFDVLSFLQVSDTELCRAEVFPHAMHLLDRFLSKKMVQKNHLQLLGTVCLLLASKMRLTRPLTVEKLRMYTDYSVNCQEILVSTFCVYFVHGNSARYENAIKDC